jgi:hypothetical protein
MSRKKTFPCGHSGKGRFCHRCQTVIDEAGHVTGNGTGSNGAQPERNGKPKRGDDEVESKADKEAWRESFEADPIPLSHLPSRNLVMRARLILAEIDKGAPWHQFNGKRLQHDRNVVSIPLGRRYRILFRTDDGAPKPVEVLSHEAYNGTKPGRR